MDILRVHSRKVKLGPNVDLMRPGPCDPRLQRRRSGGDHSTKPLWRNAGQQGIHRAGRSGRSARQKSVSAGPTRAGRWTRRKRPRRRITKRVIRWCSSCFVPMPDPIHKVTVIPRGRALGSTMTLPEKDPLQHSKKWCIALLKMCFGGRIDEEMAHRRHEQRRSLVTSARNIHRPQDDHRMGHERPLGFVFYGGTRIAELLRLPAVAAKYPSRRLDHRRGN